MNFKNIPSAIRTPLFYAEVDNSRANTALAIQRTLIIGQIVSGGTGTPNVPVISQGVADAAAVGGPNSLLALMTAAYRNADSFGEVWYLPLADDGSAVAATGTVVFSAAATANGTFYLYIANKRYALPVLTTQTTAQLATALAALINADPGCPVGVRRRRAGRRSDPGRACLDRDRHGQRRHPAQLDRGPGRPGRHVVRLHRLPVHR
jgi:phage tail sheath gpL-like